MPSLPPPARQQKTRLDPLLVGTLWVILAAVGYTASNVFLRRAAPLTDPWWATCLRALPIMLLALVGMGWHLARGTRVWPRTHLLLPLLAAGLSSQILGNAAFQYSLGVVGLAMTVPLTFSTILVGGAWLGRIWLGEPIRPRAVAAMGLLGLAIAVLSLGAGDASRSVLPDSSQATSLVIWALLAGCGSGIAYSSTSVVIRRSVVAEVPLPTIQFFISFSGVLVLGLWSAWQRGPASLAATPTPVVADLLLAGLLNFAAFYCFGVGLKHISVVHANAVNSAQIAMAALAGVLFFGESPSWPLVAGLALTLVGLALMQSAAAESPTAALRPGRSGRRLAAARSPRPAVSLGAAHARVSAPPVEETVP